MGKWLGSLAPTVQLGLFPERGFVLGIGLLCSVLDLACIGLLLHARRGQRAELGRPVGWAPAEA